MILRWNQFSDFRKTKFSDIYAIFIQVRVREVGCEGSGVALACEGSGVALRYI